MFSPFLFLNVVSIESPGAVYLFLNSSRQPGSIAELVERLALPSGLQEPVLAVPSIDQAEIGALRSWLPEGVRTVRLPWAALSAPLPAPFVQEPAFDQPIYVI